MKQQELITKELILECMSAKKRIKKSGYEFLLEKENSIMLVYKDDKLIEPVNVELPDLEAEAKIKAEEETREKEIVEFEDARAKIFELEHDAGKKDKEIIVLKEKLKKADKTLDETLIIIKEKNEEIKKLKAEAKQKK